LDIEYIYRRRVLLIWFLTQQILPTQLELVQNNTNQLLSVSNPNSLDVKSVTLYDIAGKLIFNKVNLGAKTNYEFSTAGLSEGVYIVKLQTADSKEMGQKIIVERVK